jgi:Big-like domain-containing protein
MNKACTANHNPAKPSAQSGQTLMRTSSGWVRAIIAGALFSFASPSPLSAQIPDYNWYPGYYVLNHTDTAATKQLILDDPLVAPFTGVQFRYHWAASELSPGDYSAGFATLDADLERVAAKDKKILVMLQYKKFDGTSSVPEDLRTGPGPWCSGLYCGEFITSRSSVALLWNPVVEARLNAWITAMAQHLSESLYIGNVAGIVFNETSLGTRDTTVLASANYDPDVYIQALKDNMLAATTAAPRLITILYFEGGFVSMDGNPVEAGKKIGDWMLLNPRTGAGTPDLKPKDPEGTNHPCANTNYQSSIACAPAVQARDYSTEVTDSFDQSFSYATNPVPNGLHASFFTFSYAVGEGPNAFTFADVSNNIASHPIPNITRPWPVASPPMANDDSASANEDATVTIDVASNDSDPDGDLNPASANTTCPTCATPTNGTLVNNGAGSFNYTPNANFNGVDSFAYEICDTQSACDTASVNITVTPVAAPNDDSDESEHGDGVDGHRDQ